MADIFNPSEHLIDLKGKAYLQVMWRLVWFRHDKPLWNIDTKLVEMSDNHAVFEAKIYDEEGKQKSTGYGSESIKDFKDYIEKAETKAVGRALAMLGYGTQFAPELEEGERIVDSPVAKKAPATDNMAFTCEKCGKALAPYQDVKDPEKTIGVRQHAAITQKAYGAILCLDCAKKEALKARVTKAAMDSMAGGEEK